MNKILIVEDNQLLLETIKESLFELHEISQIVTATSLFEALSILKENCFDLFVVDIGLPDGSGYDLIRKVREEEKHRFSSVFIITGLMESRDEIIRGVNEDLFQRYFTKPIDLVAFRDQVHEQLTIRLSKWVNHRLQIQKKSVNMNFLFENIVYIQTNNKMTTIACKDGNYPIGRYPLARLMKDLPADRFARAGRAYLVNLTQVQSFYKTKGQCFLKFHGVEFIVPVGSLYRTEIDERLKSIQ